MNFWEVEMTLTKTEISDIFQSICMKCVLQNTIPQLLVTVVIIKATTKRWSSCHSIPDSNQMDM